MNIIVNPINAIPKANFWWLNICFLNIKKLIKVKKNKKYNLFSKVSNLVSYPLVILYRVIRIDINIIIINSLILLGFLFSNIRLISLFLLIKFLPILDLFSVLVLIIVIKYNKPPKIRLVLLIIW